MSIDRPTGERDLQSEPSLQKAPQEAKEQDANLAQIDAVLGRYRLVYEAERTKQQKSPAFEEASVIFIATIRELLRSMYGVSLELTPVVDAFALAERISGSGLESITEQARMAFLLIQEIIKYPPALIQKIPNFRLEARKEVFRAVPKPKPKMGSQRPGRGDRYYFIHSRGEAVEASDMAGVWIPAQKTNRERVANTGRMASRIEYMEDIEISSAFHHEMDHVLAYYCTSTVRNDGKWYALAMEDRGSPLRDYPAYLLRSRRDAANEYRAYAAEDFMVAGTTAQNGLEVRKMAAYARFLRDISAGMMGEQYARDLRAGKVNASYWIGK